MTPYQHLEHLIAQLRATDAFLDSFEKFAGFSQDSPLGDSIWKIADVAINAVEQICGDENETISWFYMENDLGHRGLEAAPTGETLKPIRTVEDLAWLLGINPEVNP